MSEFNDYAVRMNDIVKAAFAEYSKASDRLTTAEENLKNNPAPMYPTDSQFTELSEKHARAQADYYKAEQGLKDVRKKLIEDYPREIKSLRGELEEALTSAFRVDPAKIDNATMELLKSGVCTPDEYAFLFKKARDANNATMARLIGKYAADASAAAVEAAGGFLNDPTATEFRIVADAANRYNGKQWLDAFDYLTNCYNRAAQNPAVLSHGYDLDGLMAAVVEKF